MFKRIVTLLILFLFVLNITGCVPEKDRVSIIDIVLANDDYLASCNLEYTFRLSSELIPAIGSYNYVYSDSDGKQNCVSVNSLWKYGDDSGGPDSICITVYKDCSIVSYINEDGTTSYTMEYYTTSEDLIVYRHSNIKETIYTISPIVFGD